MKELPLFMPMWSSLQQSISATEVSLALSGLVLAGLVKGVTGIGYATCAMPLLAMAVGLEKALALIVVPAIVSNAAVLVGGGDVVATLVRFRRLYVGILPGVACGTALLGIVDTQHATTGLAALTLVYVLIAIARPSIALPARFEQPLALPAGLLNGVLTGLTGSQILPLVPYMLALRLDADTQVIGINIAVMIASVALGASLLAAGLMTAELLALSCAGAMPAIAGTLAGNRMRGHLNVGSIRRLTLGVLVLVALSLASRGALDATLAVCASRVDGKSDVVALADCFAAASSALLTISFANELPATR